LFTSNDKGADSYNKHAQAHQIRRPEADISFHVGRCQERQSSNVDAAIKDQIYTLDCDRGVDYDTLTSLGNGFDCHLLPLVLICNQGTNIGFDATSTDSNYQDRSDEAT
jgi:hypothetical protein